MHFQHFQEQVEIGLHQKSIQKNTNPVAPTVPFQPCSALKISLISRSSPPNKLFQEIEF
jgi:hypothetical protein